MFKNKYLTHNTGNKLILGQYFNYMKLIKFCLISISIGLSITSCSSTAEYIAFSEAGKDYADSLNELIKCSGKVSLDSSSYQIVQNDTIKNFNFEGYTNRNSKDKKRLELLNQLRDQISLFKRYFTLIGDLAGVGNTIPKAVGSEITNISNDLTSIKVKLTGNSEFPTSKFNQGLGKLGELIISSEIKGALRKELETRKKTLQENLLIHKLLAEKLTDENITNLEIINSYLEDKNVVQPILSEKSSDSWINDREKAMNLQKLIWDLNTQRKISEDFSNVFEEMVTDRASLSRAKYLSTKASISKNIYASLCNYSTYKQVEIKNDQNSNIQMIGYQIKY